MTSTTLTASAVNNAARRGNALGRRLLILAAWLVFAFFLLLPLLVVASEALIGAGSAPGTSIESIAIALDGEHSAGLRRHRPPVVGRVEGGRTLLDLRSTPAEHDTTVIEALAALER